MTQPTDVYSVYDASATSGVGRGNREDLVNTVYDISPTQTPALTALPRAKAEAVLHEWTTNTLITAAANEKVEGDDIAITAAVPKVRLNNRTAISAKVAGVTHTQQAVGKVGMQDAMAEQVGYRMAEIKRDMEIMLFANTAKVAGNDSTARKSAGFPTWIVNAATVIGANPTGDGSDTATNGTQRALTEGLLQDASQLAYDDGGNPSLLIVGAFNKRVVSGFPGNQTRNTDADEKKLVNSISIYEDDFNTLKVVADRFCVSRNATLIDTEYAKVAYLRPFETFDLAKIGSTTRKQIEVEWCLEMSNPDAHATIRDLTTS
jgi:hypothetical protein